MTRTEIENAFISAKKRLFDKVYGERLNPEQCKAVFTANGPLLVLAGAGSGKTTVLVNRIAYLIKYGNAYFSTEVPPEVDSYTVEALRMAVSLAPSEIEQLLPQFIVDPCPPWQILAFTFTNKAAGEIKERLLNVFGEAEIASSIWAGTFHSICVRILRKYGERLGYKTGFSIYDEDDSKRLIAECMKELGINTESIAPKKVSNYISNAKNKLITADEYEVTLDATTKLIKRIYPLYQSKLLHNNAVDFDDIIMKVVELLSSDSEVREYYQRKFKYVLVDEYQDTNHAQFVLTSLLSGGYNNLMVVGDDDQSIYRFRGATIENILEFDKTYPEATVIKLEQNYRSTSNILELANAIIKNNDERHEKRLWCAKGRGELITVRAADDAISEGKYIIEKIVKGVREDGRRYSDFAVLYRINALGRSLQTTFAKSGIPYRVVGDMGFYDRKEIKDMIAYMSIVSFPGDDLRLKRIINEPKRKIGQATVDAIAGIAKMNGMSMYEVIKRVDEYPALAKSREKLTAFVNMIDGIRERYTRPKDVLTALYQESGYEEMLRAEGFEGESKMENVGELISATVEYERKIEEAELSLEVEAEPTLLGFLEEVSLITSVDKYDEGADAVVLMTIHAAKGLEFPVVFIAGMEDGIFPSESNRSEKSEMNEERRLAYVAITRAKDKLYITYARERMMYGRSLYGILSTFIKNEAPTSLLTVDTPRVAPPRRSYYGGGSYNKKDEGREYEPIGGEMSRPVSRSVTSSARQSRAESFGIKRLRDGTRVSHMTFGAGVILSSKDMGGDVLYEVKFDTGVTKRLMATYAKLKEI